MHMWIIPEYSSSSFNFVILFWNTGYGSYSYHTHLISQSHHTHVILISHSYHTHITLISYSYRTHIILISHSYRTHIALRSYSYRTHIAHTLPSPLAPCSLRFDFALRRRPPPSPVSLALTPCGVECGGGRAAACVE